MFSTGDELFDERFRERYLVLESARDSGGELLRIEDTAMPGPSRCPVSAHPHQEERFEVLSGTLALTVNGEEHLLRSGETFVVPPGATHLPRNAGDGELRFIAEMRPRAASRSSWPRSRPSTSPDATGLPTSCRRRECSIVFPDVEHPSPQPRPLERGLFASLAAAGKLLDLQVPSAERPPEDRSPSTLRKRQST